MTDIKTAFEKEISAWIIPSQLAACSKRLSKDFIGATQETGFYLSSDILRNSGEGNYRPLIETYLRSFSIPEPLLALSRFYAPLTDNAYEQLRTLRFEGGIDWNPTRPTNMSLADGLTPIAYISERDFVVDLLISPLRMLTILIGDFAKTWKLIPVEMNTFFHHSHHNEFATYIEGSVAEYYRQTPMLGAGVAQEKSNQMILYRAVVLAGGSVVSSEDIKLCTQFARHQGKSTHEAIE